MDKIGARAPQRPRRRRRRPFPAHRRMVIDSMGAGRRSFPVHGLLQVDVTNAVAVLDAREPPPSFTAFIAAATGRAVATHPNVRAYRDWRGARPG